MQLNDILGPLICGILGGIAATALFIKYNKKSSD